MGFFKELSDKLSQDIKDLDTDDNNKSLEETGLYEEDSSTQSEGTGETYVSKLRDERRVGYIQNSEDDGYFAQPKNTVKEEINNIMNSLEDEEQKDVTPVEDVASKDTTPKDVTPKNVASEEAVKKDEESKEEAVSVNNNDNDTQIAKAEESKEDKEKTEEKEIVKEAEVVKDEIKVKEEEKEKIVGTVITKNTIIAGNIATVDNMEIYGAVRGDVECKGNLAIFGEVAGNATAANININTAKFEGDLASEGCVEVGVGTVVIGNINANSAYISGAVKGEIDVCGPVVLEATAIVKGNIKAKTVKIDNGAVLQGFCELAHSDMDIDNFFEPELPELEVQKKMGIGSDDGDKVEDTSSKKNMGTNDETKQVVDESENDKKEKFAFKESDSATDYNDDISFKQKEDNKSDDMKYDELDNKKNGKYSFVLDDDEQDDDTKYNQEKHDETDNVSYEVGELLDENFEEKFEKEFDNLDDNDDFGFVIEDNEVINENLYKGNKLSEL